jgi:hypothetical protein
VADPLTASRAEHRIQGVRACPNYQPYKPRTVLAVESLKVALVSLLEANPGEIYYIDDVIALLFGEVEASQTGRVRDTVTKMLSQGKLSGRFESVPGKKGCYTLSCSLLEAQSPALSPR